MIPWLTLPVALLLVPTAWADDGSLLLHTPADNSPYFAKANNDIVFLQGGYYGCELQDNCFGIAGRLSLPWGHPLIYERGQIATT